MLVIYYGMSPLHYVVENHNLSAFKYLIDHGANTKTKNNIILIMIMEYHYYIQHQIIIVIALFSI